ncbi:MAG: galactose mutarotase [Bacteroidales bacterium]|nr:galactose mutarotase [Bacteroidales bacterium]
MKYILVAASFLFFLGCKSGEPSQQTGLIDKSRFDTLIDGKNVALFTMINTNNLQVSVTNYGARVVSIGVPVGENKFVDVALGFRSIKDYLNSPDVYFGPCVGRVGNRIAKGKFFLDGKEYTLAVNNGPNHLHGGLKGLHKVVWDFVSGNDSTIVLRYLSPDMEEGYPGNLEITLTYSLSTDNTLSMEYEAVTDKPTPVNLTNHSYFNLSGKGSTTINNHILTINADDYTPVDSTLIPLGTIEPVEGTPFDFRKPKAIGTDLALENEQLRFGAGYDHNFALNKTAQETFTFAARVYSPESGVQMEIYTTGPGLQFYGGNFFTGEITGKDGEKVGYRCGIALEPQHFPDAPNQSSFESIILLPGQKYLSASKYTFSVNN